MKWLFSSMVVSIISASASAGILVSDGATYVDNSISGDTTGYSEVGFSGNDGTATQNGAYDTGRFAAPGIVGSAATFSPSLATGNYTIQVHSPSAGNLAPNAQWTVNHTDGSSSFAYNQTQDASQGVATGLPGSGNYSGGWYTIGTFTLDSSSNVVLDRTDTNGFLIADAVRFQH